jgi:hypothetical protein
MAPLPSGSGRRSEGRKGGKVEGRGRESKEGIKEGRKEGTKADGPPGGRKNSGSYVGITKKIVAVVVNGVENGCDGKL